MSLLDKIKQSEGFGVNEATINIEPFGDVLFREPTQAENEMITKHLSYSVDPVSTEGKGEVKMRVDIEKSDMVAHGAAMITFTMRDPETGNRLFETVGQMKDVLFAKKADGSPKFGKSVIDALAKAAQSVINPKSVKEQEKNLEEIRDE